jgi:hypothetical protein
MTDATPLESLVQDELIRAGKGQEALAITRAWRAMSLRSLTRILAGREQNHLGVLGVVIHAAELYGYTLLNVSLASDGQMVRFARMGITEVMQYLDWCHVFFDHLGTIAAVLPEPVNASTNVELVAKANAAVLKDMLEQLCDESGKVQESEECARAAGHAEAMGTIGISVQTFQGLGKALASVICAWMTPQERQRFIEGISAGSAEMTDLHELVRLHVNERNAGPGEDVAQDAATPDTLMPQR